MQPMTIAHARKSSAANYPMNSGRGLRSSLLGATALGLLIAGVITLAGCASSSQKPADPPALPVQVATPVAEEVTDFDDFQGSTVSLPSVDLRARVTGYLEKVLFKEGMEVKAGDRLFVIDRSPYQAAYDQALANVSQAKAHLERVTADYHRAQELLPRRAISQSDFDLAKGDHDEGAAAVEVAQAALKNAKLNLDWTIVTAPISGRISWQRMDPGNLVQANTTLLTTIVALDPIFAYFYVDERSMLRARRLIRAGKMKSAQETQIPIFLGLSDEEGYPHEGKIDFVDNAVDQMTGELRIRGVFPNPGRLISPGMFARIRVPLGSPHRALLVSERALGMDQGKRFLYVIDAKDTVVYRPVEVGALVKGLRVIETGLSPGERVALSGLQQIRPKTKVAPQPVTMTAEEPILRSASAAKKASGSAAPSAAAQASAPAAEAGQSPLAGKSLSRTKAAPAGQGAGAPPRDPRQQPSH